MKKRLAKIIFVILLLSPVCTQATIVDITVATNKPVYQLGEYVTISVTAYNPNSESVTLNGGSPLASYTMDNIYNWADWHTSPFPVIINVTIQPNNSYTWVLTHDTQEMQRYPLELGMHTVVGKILALEVMGDNESIPLQFEVIPEPTTLLLFGIGTFLLRKSHK